MKSHPIRRHWPPFLPGTPRPGLQSSCHWRWPSAYLFAVLSSLYVDCFLEKILFCTDASTTRVETKGRPREPLVSKKMGENFLVEVKIIPTGLEVQRSVSGPTEYSISCSRPAVLIPGPCCPVISPWACPPLCCRVCGQEGTAGCGLLSVGLGHRGSLWTGSSAHLWEAAQEPTTLGRELTMHEAPTKKSTGGGEVTTHSPFPLWLKS